MKKISYSKINFIGVTVAILLAGLLTGFADSIDKTPDCPPDTDPFLSRGIRGTRNCSVTVTELGYWWHKNGEVIWVESKRENCEGTFEISSRIITYQGKQLICLGMEEICWACSCQYKNLDSTVEIQ